MKLAAFFALLFASTSAPFLPSCAAQTAPLTALDVKLDFGARGDGRTDDTAAFAKLATEVNRRDGGVSILIPPGTYKVGGQIPNGLNADKAVYRFDGRDVLMFRDCAKPIQIQGTGAIMRLPDGMRFGSFNAGGQPFSPPLPYWDTRGSAITGYMVGAVGCADVRISGLELNGNNTNYVLGGAWGDRERQARSYGYYFDHCRRVELDKVSAHHFGLDGIYIKAFHLKATDAPRPHILRNSRFEWNGRQGLSWSGGIGLRATSCSFSHTGYAVNTRSGQPVYSGPGAGVDIEAELSVTRDGIFESCDFFHTRGPALYCEIGDNADVVFRNSRFWNFDNHSMVPKAPRLTFVDCRIYGSAISAYTNAARPSDGTRFVRCTFEDKSHPQYGQPFVDAYGSLLGFDDLRGGLRMEDCTFIAHRVKGPFLRQPNAGATGGFTIDGGSMRLEHFNGPNESIATLQGGVVRNFRVETAFTRAAPAGLHVWTNNQTLVDETVDVAGPGVRWRATDGEVGRLRR